MGVYLQIKLPQGRVASKRPSFHARKLLILNWILVVALPIAVNNYMLQSAEFK
jgi:hypothetical protein